MAKFNEWCFKNVLIPITTILNFSSTSSIQKQSQQRVSHIDDLKTNRVIFYESSEKIGILRI